MSESTFAQVDSMSIKQLYSTLELLAIYEEDGGNTVALCNMKQYILELLESKNKRRKLSKKLK